MQHAHAQDKNKQTFYLISNVFLLPLFSQELYFKEIWMRYTHREVLMLTYRCCVVLSMLH